METEQNSPTPPTAESNAPRTPQPAAAPTPTASSRTSNFWLWGIGWTLVIALFVAIGFQIIRSQQAHACLGTQTTWKKPSYLHFKNFQAAVASAKKAKKPIFLDLYADWCYPCKKLERETFSHPSVRKLLAKFMVVKFNIDKPEGRWITRRFWINRYPTTLLLHPDGREAERIVGYYPPRYFRAPLKAVLAGKGTYVDLKRRYKKNNKDLKLALALADRALLRRQLTEARQLYTLLHSLDKDGKKGIGPAALYGLARTRTRIARYADALPFLQRFHKNYRQHPLQIDAFRLQIYAYQKLRKRSRNLKKRQAFDQRYKSMCLQFKRRYPGRTTFFE